MHFSNRIVISFSVITRSNSLAGCDEVISAIGGRKRYIFLLYALSREIATAINCLAIELCQNALFSVITRSNPLAGGDVVISFSPITAKGGDCRGNKLPRNDGEKDRKSALFTSVFHFETTLMTEK